MMITYNEQLYPVNKFQNNEWVFDINSEENFRGDISQTAYSLFKFLVHSNLIYSIEKILFIGGLNSERVQSDFALLLNEFIKSSSIPIKLLFCFQNWYQNLQILNNKIDLKYYSKANLQGVSYK